MSKNVKRLAKLEAMKGELTELAKKAAEGKQRIALAKAKTDVNGRFVKLMAARKMSPAEFKKIDVTRLAKLDADSLNTVMEMYEGREALLKAGQQGTVNAANFIDVGTSEEREIAKMKSAARKNLSKRGVKFKHLEADDKELSVDEADDKKLEAEVESSPVAEEAPAAEVQQLEEVQQMVEENSAQIARISSMVDALMEDAKEEDEAGEEEAAEEEEVELKESEQSDKAEEDK